MTIIKRIPCLGILVLGAIAAAVCIAACGGSSSTKTTSASSSKDAAFVSCLEKHGVSSSVATSFEKRTTSGFTHGKVSSGKFSKGKAPSGKFPKGKAARGGKAPKAGTGGFFGSGTGTHKGFATSSKFTAAMKDCDSKLGKSAKAFAGGAAGFSGKRPSGKLKSSFSTATLDKFVSCIRKDGYAAMPAPKKESTPGQFFPKSVEDNPKFKKALPKCESIITKAFRRGGASTTTTGSNS